MNEFNTLEERREAITNLLKVDHFNPIRESYMESYITLGEGQTIINSFKFN